MNNRRMIVRLLMALLLLVGVHFLVDFWRGVPETSRVTAALLDPTVEVSAVNLVFAEAPAVTLVGDGDWKLTAPVAAPADRKAVMRLLDALANAPVSDVFSEKELLKLGRTRADFLLEVPRVKVTVVTSGGCRTIAFGGPTPAGDEVYAAVSGERSVFSVPAEVLSAIDVPLDTLRRKSLFQGDPLTVNAFTLRNEKGRHRVFQRDGEGWKSDGEPASDEAVTALLKALADNEAVDFVWPRGTSNEVPAVSATMLASYGLDPESSPMAMLGGREGASERITFGKAKTEGGPVYALVDNGTAIVTVPPAVASLVSGDYDRFFDHRLFPLEPAKIKSLLLSENGRTLAL